MDHHKSVVKGGSVSQNAPFGTTIEKTSYFTENGKLWYLIILIFLIVTAFFVFCWKIWAIVIIYWWWCWQGDSNSAWVSTYSTPFAMPRKPSWLPASISKQPSSPPVTSTISRPISQPKASIRSHPNGRPTSEATPLTCRPITTLKESSWPTSEPLITQLWYSLPMPPSDSWDVQAPPTKMTMSPTSWCG